MIFLAMSAEDCTALTQLQYAEPASCERTEWCGEGIAALVPVADLDPAQAFAPRQLRRVPDPEGHTGGALAGFKPGGRPAIDREPALAQRSTVRLGRDQAAGWRSFGGRNPSQRMRIDTRVLVRSGSITSIATIGKY